MTKIMTALLFVPIFGGWLQVVLFDTVKGR